MTNADLERSVPTRGAPGAERRRRPRAYSHPPLSLRATATLADLAPPPSTNWIRDYRRLAFATDTVGVLAASVVGVWLRYGIIRSPIEIDYETHLPYRFAVLGIAAVWLVVNAMSGCYDPRYLGNGSDEFK